MIFLPRLDKFFQVSSLLLTTLDLFQFFLLFFLGH
jgi:hypothetical protein